MKQLVTILAIMLCCAPIRSQTKVIKMSATKSTDYGVQYFLPKTSLLVEATYTKTTRKAGIYAKYAERFLGIDPKTVIADDAVEFSLDRITVKSRGVVDKKEGYLIEFKSKTTSPFVCLTEDGLICTVNADYTAETHRTETVTAQVKTQTGINAQSVFTEEYLRAGSTMKMAEVAAKQIYSLRESRNDLLTGNADNAPRDGEGMKIVLANLEAQEKTLTELFTGSTVTETAEAEFEVEPLDEIVKETIFRFSRYEGIVDADDLSGSPVYLNLTRAEKPEETATADEKKKKEKQEPSIVYNVPGKGSVEVYFGVRQMFKGDFQIVQFGKKQTLATSLFDDKKAPVRIYFYPELGSIRQIIQ